VLSLFKARTRLFTTTTFLIRMLFIIQSRFSVKGTSRASCIA